MLSLFVYSSSIAQPIGGGGMIGGPPIASESTRGVAKLATSVQATAVTDDTTIMTPYDVGLAIAAVPGIGANETYGSGWNADTSTPEKDDIYDYLHLIDTNDDGDVDTIDSTLWATKLNASEKAAASGVASLDGSSKVVQNPASATTTPSASSIPLTGGTTTIDSGWIPDLSGTYIAVSQKAAISGVASLDGSSKVVQDPANATATPTASKIPIADGSGDLDAGWIPTLNQDTTGSAGGLNPSIGTNSGNYSGIYVTLTSGQSTSLGQVCYFNSSGLMALAKGNALATTDGLLGIATGTINSAPGIFLLRGFICNSGWSFATVGGPVYISEGTSGLVTQTVPAAGNFVRKIGWAYSATVLYLDPSPDILGN